MGIVEVIEVTGKFVNLHLVGTDVEVGREDIVLATEDVAVNRKFETAVGNLTYVLILLGVTSG